MLNDNNRALWIWTLVALTAAYGLLNVVLFYTQDSFGTVWFTTSLAVYGVLLFAAVLLATVDVQPARSPSEDAEGQPIRAGFKLVEERVLYETATGRLLEAKFKAGETEETLVFAVTQDEVLPLEEVEARLDALDLGVPANPPGAQLDGALEARAFDPPSPPAEGPSTTPDDETPAPEVTP